ncbi:hypothetical protein [Parasitella parasitica]|uniref:Uncharacterized protein n=1 Tax=Parasitella parasitica TaxID=35722 RepID=A0A0B7NRG4_9FUNG|nr:hypothetical protein [Parasitella parasitica]
MKTLLGTIIDPLADKVLMTVMTVSLAMEGTLPVPLAAIILGRDAGLILSAFYYRYISLPEPKTIARYFDGSIPSAEVKPTQISKINTALQLILMGFSLTTVSMGVPSAEAMMALQWVVGGTTIWSGASYLFSKDAQKAVPHLIESTDNQVKLHIPKAPVFSFDLVLNSNTQKEEYNQYLLHELPKSTADRLVQGVNELHKDSLQANNRFDTRIILELAQLFELPDLEIYVEFMEYNGRHTQDLISTEENIPNKSYRIDSIDLALK